MSSIFVLFVVAFQASGNCVSSYGMLNNSCDALKHLDDPCSNESPYNVPQIFGDNSYSAANNSCQCSKVYFNLHIACELCRGNQSQKEITWSQWTRPCPFDAISYEPSKNNDTLPLWSFINTNLNDRFDIDEVMTKFKPPSIWSNGLTALLVSVSIVALLSAVGVLYAYRYRIACLRRLRLKARPLKPYKKRTRPTISDHAKMPSSSSLRPIINITSTSSSDPDNRIDLLQPYSHSRSQSSSKKPLPPNIEVDPITGSPPDPRSEISFTTRFRLGMRAAMGKIGLGPREVHSNHFRLESDPNGRVRRAELDLAESDQGGEMERGEYTLVAGGEGGGSMWRNRNREIGHGTSDWNDQSGVVDPFIVPSLRAGFNSDETIAAPQQQHQKDHNTLSQTPLYTLPNNATSNVAGSSTSIDRDPPDSNPSRTRPPLSYSRPNHHTYPGRGNNNKGYVDPFDREQPQSQPDVPQSVSHRGSSDLSSFNPYLNLHVNTNLDPVMNPNPFDSHPANRSSYQPTTRLHEVDGVASGLASASRSGSGLPSAAPAGGAGHSHSHSYTYGAGIPIPGSYKYGNYRSTGIGGRIDDERDDEGMVLITPYGDDYTIYSSSGVTCSPTRRSPPMPPPTPLPSTPPGFR